MRKIKILAAILFAAVSATFAVTVSAAAYTDIQDPETALAVSVLDALDVVEGFPDGGYHPNETLTRAQFCKLAILLLDLEDGLISASQRALFYDVTGSHWAAPYVNLAYENGFIQGYGNGMFGPDDNVTYAQILTVFLRILGYSDAEIGSVYPDDTMHMANKLKLTEGVERLPGEAVTRGETAKLLINLVDTENKAGIKIYSVLADKTVEGVTLLDDDCVSLSGKANCAKLYQGAQVVYYEKGAEIPTFAVGCKGAALLNKDDELLAIVPDGTRYTMAEGVLLSSNDRSEDPSAEVPYEVDVYSDGTVFTYPRAGAVSANLTGSVGTLLLDEKGYAETFISADTDVYTLVKGAVLLDEDDTSSSGDANCAKLYINAQTVWYEKSGTVPKSSVGSEGTALIDSDGEIFAFAADGDRYTVVEGILISASERADKGSELAYNAVIYSDGKRIEYPRANNISAALVGAGGALLLDEKGYASAFIADDSDYYTVVDEAVLLTVDDGDDRAEFYMSGKQAKYKLADGYNVSDGDEGSEGVILLDGDDFVFAFISGEDEYSVEYGILTEAYSSKAVFIIDGDEEKYELDCSLSATLIGASGKILINDYGEVTAFIPEGSGGSVIKGAVLLDNNSTSDSGKKNSALFYVNGAKVWYERAGKLNNSLVGCSGSVVLDEDGLVIEFITDGDEYSVEWGHLVALSGSKGTFYIDDDIEEIRLSGTISPTSVGSYGIILLDGRERVVSFVEDSSEEGYTLGAKGILLSANDTAADGRTKVAKLYTGGAVVTVKVSERIKESNVGLVGYLLLDEDGSAVDFIEDDTNVSDVLLVSADTGTLVSDDSSYRMSAGIPVIYDGELTSWGDVCDDLAVDTEIAIYFNIIGEVDVLIIE